MKKFLLALVAIATVAASITLAAVPAQATACDSRSGVCTAREYRAVQKGQSKARVAKILDGYGKQSFAYTIAGTRYETRDYGRISLYTKMCSVDFKNGRVIGKMRI
jgi:Ni/Co efflux regulator RcnB